MKFKHITHALRLMLATILVGGAVGNASATGDFPTQPIRFLVPFAAGGAVDNLTRLVAKEMEKSLGQSVVVENRPGGNGVVGTGIVARSKPDGHTLIMVSTSHVVNPSLLDSLPYDTMKDLKPVTMAAKSPLVFVASPNAPFQDIPSLIQHALEKPGEVSYGSGGVGSTAHLAGEMFSQITEANMVHVPYQGTAAAYPDLLTDRLSLLIDNMVLPIRYAGEGKIKPLAVTTSTRAAALPSIPTIQETGVKGAEGFDVSAWFGVIAPGETPDAVVRTLADAISSAVQTEEVRSVLQGQGVEAVGNSPENFKTFLAGEIEGWRSVIEKGNLKSAPK